MTTQSPTTKWILAATILASGMAFLDGSVVNIALPQIQAGFNSSLTAIAWIVNSYALVLAALLLAAGSLGDIYGRKKLFITGIILFTLGSLACALSPNIIVLIMARAFQGLGGAVMIPGSLAIINTAIPQEVRGRAIGLWSGYAGGVAAIGPFLGGFLVQHFGWPSIFYINIPLGLLAIFIAVKFVDESKNPDAKKVDWLGTFLITLALLGLAYGLMSGPDSGWLKPEVLFSLIIGSIALVSFVVVEKKSREPMVPFKIFNSALVTGANLVTLFLYFALNGCIFFLVLNLQQAQGFSPINAGLGLLPAVLIITFLSGPAGTLADKHGPRVQMILGPILVSIGMAWLAFASAPVNYFTSFLPGLTLFGLGMACIIAPLTKSALDVAPNYSGAASGVNNAVSRVAALMAVAVLGALAISIFTKNLNTNLQNTSLNTPKQQQIMSQANKLGGVEMPSTFSKADSTIAKQMVVKSFVTGFRWLMGINSFLALLSAVIAFVLIRPKPENK